MRIISRKCNRNVESLMKVVSARGVKNRKFFAFGSYTWAAASVRLLLEQATALGFEPITLPEGTAGAQAGGLTFPQAYSPQKFDTKALAEAIRKEH